MSIGCTTGNRSSTGGEKYASIGRAPDTLLTTGIVWPSPLGFFDFPVAGIIFVVAKTSSFSFFLFNDFNAANLKNSKSSSSSIGTICRWKPRKKNKIKTKIEDNMRMENRRRQRIDGTHVI